MNYITEDTTGEQLVELSETTPSVEFFTEVLLGFLAGRFSTDDMQKFVGEAIKLPDAAELFIVLVNSFPLTSELKELMKLLVDSNKLHLVDLRFLDPETLSQLNVVPADTLTRKLNHTKRDAFFTQKKYNLLHEEPEGFSRLIVELMTILRSGESKNKVKYGINVVNKIIGHYSLDPHRALDICFDCFTNHLVSNEFFIVEFLKQSYWWPLTPSDNSSLESLSVGGNLDLTKLIALKFIKQSDRQWPETMRLLIAILIKEGIISFGSLYPYFPSSDMEAIEELQKKEVDEKLFKSTANALALAAPLEEESADTPTEQKEKVSLESLLAKNFKYQMLKTFLSIGLYWPSIFMLTEYPFLAEVDDEVTHLITRLYHHMIAPLYEQYTDFSSSELAELSSSKKVCIARPNNEVAYDDVPYSTLLTFKATIQNFSLKRFIFFYDNWTDGLPTIETTEQLFSRMNELLKFVNPIWANDPGFFEKVCIIGAHQAPDHKDVWFKIIRTYILPAVSIIEHNNIVIDKAYDILKHYSKEDRFNLYGEIHQVTSKNNPWVKLSYGKATKATRDALKRLSKETIKQLMKKLAKISFSNPLPCFLTILQQIESYDNLIELVVEAARYFNEYSWDNLTLAVMIRITTAGRSNISSNGLFDKLWIQSLASFIGKLGQKYPRSIDLSTLIEFILKLLHDNDTSVLVVVKEILISMGGHQVITNLNLSQIYRLNSSDSIKRIVYETIKDKRYSNIKLSRVLINTLQNLDALNELLVLLAQIDNELTYNDDRMHLKVLTSRKDDLLVVVQLLIEIVRFSLVHVDLLTVAEYLDYGVPKQWAYDLTRSSTVSLEPEETFWQLQLYDIFYDASIYDHKKANKQEQEDHEKHVAEIHEQIKDIDFSTLSTGVLLSRCLNSSFDAVYTAKFISIQSLDVIGKLVATVKNILFTSTNIEAENWGIFFNEILAEKKPYEVHETLLSQLSESLSSTDYMLRRNAITFLKNVVSVYPIIEDHCESLAELLDDIGVEETRDDLKLSINALVGHVKSRSKTWVHKWDFLELEGDELETMKSARQEVLKKREEIENARKEKERKEREERERIQKIKAEEERKEREEKERIEREQQEKEEKERLEKERIENEQKEKEEKERQEKERLEKEKLEAEKKEQERKERERYLKEKLEKDKLERERERQKEAEEKERQERRKERLQERQQEQEYQGRDRNYGRNSYPAQGARKDYRKPLPPPPPPPAPSAKVAAPSGPGASQAPQGPQGSQGSQGSRKRRYDYNNRYDNSGRYDNGRYDNSGRYDNRNDSRYDSRYDKRQKYN